MSVGSKRAAVLLAAILSVGPIVAENSETLPPIDSVWDFRDPAASEQRFRALIARTGGENHRFYRAEAMTQLARSIGLQRRFDEALTLLDAAESLLAPGQSRGRVRMHLERGRVINSSGDPAGSIHYFEQALESATALNEEYLAIDAAHMLGIVTPADVSVGWNLAAIDMAEAAQDPRARSWLGSLYNNLGWTFFELERFEDALALFEKDIVFREARGQAYEASIARWSRAKTLRLLGRVAEALGVQRALLDHPERRDDDLAQGYTHEETGECLLELGRPDEAAKHFASAYALLGNDPWLKANDGERLARLKRLGDGDSRSGALN